MPWRLAGRRKSVYRGGATRAERGDGMDSEMQEQVRCVRNYYDQYGWRSLADGRLVDVALFVDDRAVSRIYRARERRRDRHLLPPQGGFFLDAASGALPYTDYSQRFRRHVCVDISMRGLQEARRRSGLEARGLYVNADLRRLPFASTAFDAVLSAHTLYHIPAQGQVRALAEMIRVLMRDGAILVLYSNVDSLSFRIKRLWERLTRRTVVLRRSADVPRVFSEPIGKDALEAIITEAGGCPVFLCHSFMSQQMLQRMVPDCFLGHGVLRIIYGLESSFPRLTVPLGHYFSIQICRPARRAGRTDG